MPRRFGLAVEAWLAGDRGAWDRAAAARGAFDTAAVAGHWRPKTRAQACYAYGRWLAYLQRDAPHALDLPLAERVTPAILRDFVADCAQRLSDMSVAAELQHLSLAVRALAPEADWRWLRQLQYHFQRRARPREKRDRIVDPRRLLALGAQLMDQAATATRTLDAARLARDGLLIALLAARPLRRRGLAALELGQNFHRVGDRYVIELAPEDTKAGQAVEFEAPAFLTAAIAMYVARYRPLFPAAQTCNALWLSSKGGALSDDAIYGLVCRRTRGAFGTSISPHLFRDIAVTAIAREAPGALAVARDLLTHAKTETTQHFYSRAQAADAARRHALTLEQLRSRRKESGQHRPDLYAQDISPPSSAPATRSPDRT